MTLIYQPLVPITTPRRPLVGCATRHGNSAWTTSVRALRAVLIAARAHAPCERVPSGDAAMSWPSSSSTWPASSPPATVPCSP